MLDTDLAHNPFARGFARNALVVTPETKGRELSDLTRDPGETTDLAAAVRPLPGDRPRPDGAAVGGRAESGIRLPGQGPAAEMTGWHPAGRPRYNPLSPVEEPP